MLKFKQFLSNAQAMHKANYEKSPYIRDFFLCIDFWKVYR